MGGGGVWILVGPLVFKTSEAEYLGLAGSIPVRLRQLFRSQEGSAVDDAVQQQVHGAIPAPMRCSPYRGGPRALVAGP